MEGGGRDLALPRSIALPLAQRCLPGALNAFPKWRHPLKWTRPISGSAEPRSAPQAPLLPSPAAGCSAAISAFPSVPGSLSLPAPPPGWPCRSPGPCSPRCGHGRVTPWAGPQRAGSDSGSIASGLVRKSARNGRSHLMESWKRWEKVSEVMGSNLLPAHLFPGQPRCRPAPTLPENPNPHLS